MDPSFVSDKRKKPRFQVSIPVSRILYKDRRIISHTFDISEDGIGLVMDSELPLGEPIDMCLYMPDNGEPINFQGKAVWMTVAGPGRYRAGVRIEEDHLKPIPIVLRTISVRSYHYG